MRTRAWSLCLIVALLVGLAGCGGEEDGGGVASADGTAARASAQASASLRPEDARLKFAQCMRRNGIDMPDPQPDRNLRTDLRPGGDRRKLQAALEACRHFLEASGMTIDPDDPEIRDAMVKFAQCARRNGIDIPDPKPGEGFGGLLGRDRAAFEKARPLCGHHLQEIRRKVGR
ncbi:hypothetical protein [Actinomadura sp. SCN-SB]|uniref:hypothetical protein n=1 Tax=Actinomadura sp. SCN-SB TaxID=3373092 RepID=UPI0037536168